MSHQHSHSSAGYEPPSKQITDTYKVFVSPKKMYLEPFLQRSLTDYHRALSYSICSYGHRVRAHSHTPFMCHWNGITR